MILIEHPVQVSRRARTLLFAALLSLPCSMGMGRCEGAPQAGECKASERCAEARCAGTTGIACATKTTAASVPDAGSRAGQRDSGSQSESGGGPDSGAADSGDLQNSSAAESGGAGQSGSGGQSGSAGPSANAGQSGRAGTAGRDAAAAGSGGDEPVRCGSGSSVQCEANKFCMSGPDKDCGTVAVASHCELKWDGCADIYHAVCGCDHRTYDNDCSAHSLGVAIKAEGACSIDDCTAAGGRVVLLDKPGSPNCDASEESWSLGRGIEQEKTYCCRKLPAEGKACGGSGGATCDDGQFCKQAGGEGCGDTVANTSGVCTPLPQGHCTRDYWPVCGCDRRTYNNACEARAAGVSVIRDGGCTARDCAAIGGRVATGTGSERRCNANETEHSSLAAVDNPNTSDALCCVPK